LSLEFWHPTCYEISPLFNTFNTFVNLGSGASPSHVGSGQASGAR
jgi:hypothetical protein